MKSTQTSRSWQWRESPSGTAFWALHRGSDCTLFFATCSLGSTDRASRPGSDTDSQEEKWRAQEKETRINPHVKAPSRRINWTRLKNKHKTKPIPSKNKLFGKTSDQKYFSLTQKTELTIHTLKLENRVQFYLLLAKSTSHCKSPGGPFSKAEDRMS